MPFTAATTDKVTKVGNPGTATTMSAPGYTAGSSTSMTVGSTTNWPTDTKVIFAVDRAQVVNNVEERIAGTYNEFEGIVTGSNTISDVVKRLGTTQNYPAGSLTRVYIPVAATRENDLVEGFGLEHNLDGSHQSGFLDLAMLADAVAQRLFKPGDMKFHGRSTLDSGWLWCDGSAVSRTTYADLFAAIGTSFGAGNGSSTFNLPDIRSRSPVGAGQGKIDMTVLTVDITNDVVTVTPDQYKHLYTGQAVTLTSTGTLPGGLATGTTYYVLKSVVAPEALKLCATRTAAVDASGWVNITSTGSGTTTVTHTYSSRALGEMGGEETHTLTLNEMASHTHSTANVAFSDRRASSTVAGSSNAEGVLNNQASRTSTASGGNSDHNVMNPFTAVNYIIKT